MLFVSTYFPVPLQVSQMYCPSGVRPIPLHVGHLPAAFSLASSLVFCLFWDAFETPGFAWFTPWDISVETRGLTTSSTMVAHDDSAKAVSRIPVLILECPIFALDGQALGTFLDVADDLRVDVERLADSDYLLGHLGTDIDLHAVAHIEYLIHLAPIGA